ncbi:uncharacterized protein LOC128331957 [Hemicordylus capensis]|uniref:uncharacterized protein LOC128331957 n=1 Tax=Hemicordylus capensis TaxID=884348 RepID=UPI0023042ABB|nr:uncharacterized protein LOC128331957 [Hemicordylus capensis]XP_053122046.1 uncharacterized protein LOC128331957 [Hemicordylus capensis]XP_053122047.1 uncharacterized protein LOC128331957 [Hemicordylus capensis]
MFPSIHAGNQCRCTFDSKGQFTTNLDLALARNQVHASQQPRSPPERECWIRQPPDFSYRLYISPSRLRKPLGKSKELKKKKKTTTGTLCEELHRIRSRLFLQVMEQEAPREIITRFPRVGPYEAQLLFVKNGKFKSGKYQDPKPYDYRQYESDIPNFVTSYVRDPLNIKFKLQCLSKVHGLHPLTEEKREPTGKFITYKPRELKWDSRLILPKEPWPAKPGSFTRHRGPRGAHSAFIERVEDTLSKLWQEEANQRQARSRRKPGGTRQKSPGVPGERGYEMEEARRQQGKSLQKAPLPQSASSGALGWGVTEQTKLGLHLKPEPLGFLLPSGIAQSVAELRYK